MAKGIYKRGTVYWVRYAGLDGRIIRESTGKKKLKEAEDFLLDRRQAIKRGEQPDIVRIANHTFKELSLEYLKWAERQRSYVQKACNMKQLVEEFGNYPLRAISTKLLEQYQTCMLNKQLKPATINRHIALIKHAFTKAADWNMIEEGALKRVRKVKLLPENNRRLRYLSKEECELLLKTCDKMSAKGSGVKYLKTTNYKNLKPIIIMALNAGMRRGEILSLKWENVDLRHGFILLNQTKNGDRREIPINNTLKQTLEALPRRIDNGYVFFNALTGEGYDDIKNSFNRLCKKAGIRDFHFHDLRHTFASHLVMSGVDLTTVSRLLGHKNITMTLRYSHLAPKHLKDAVNILDNLLGENSTAQKVHNL